MCVCVYVSVNVRTELKNITGSLNEQKSNKVFFVVEKGDTTKKSLCPYS